MDSGFYRTDKNWSLGGRFPKNILKTEKCEISLDGISVVHRGMKLKKVNTAVINSKPTSYFKCQNMRTPTRKVDICEFSARIINFDTKKFIEFNLDILNEHSTKCQLKLENQSKNNTQNEMINISNSSEKVKSNEKDINITQNFFISDIYVQLWSEEDYI